MDLIHILKTCDQILHFLHEHLTQIPEWQFFEILSDNAEFFCFLHTTLPGEPSIPLIISPDSAIRLKMNEGIVLNSEDPLIITLVSYLMHPMSKNARPTTALSEFIQMKVNALKAHHWIRWTPQQVLIYALENPLSPALTIYQFHDETTTIFIFQHLHLSLVYTWSINPTLTESIAHQEKYALHLRDQLQIAEAQLRNQTQLQEKLKVIDEKGYKLKETIRQLESEKTEIQAQFDAAQIEWENDRRKFINFEEEMQNQLDQLQKELIVQKNHLIESQTSVKTVQSQLEKDSSVQEHIIKQFSLFLEKIKHFNEELRKEPNN